MADFLAREATFLGSGKTQGRLYILGAYPGLVTSTEVLDQVLGDIFELHDPEATFRVLDRYEDLPVADPMPGKFYRNLGIVVSDRGENLLCQIYFFHGPVEKKTHIPSGDYLQTIK